MSNNNINTVFSAFQPIEFSDFRKQSVHFIVYIDRALVLVENTQNKHILHLRESISALLIALRVSLYVLCHAKEPERPVVLPVPNRGRTLLYLAREDLGS